MIGSQSKTSFEAAMNKLTHGNDYNYQGFGNKRATKEDYDRYKASMSYFRSAPDKADLPSVDAENLRRDKRWKTGGTIGTYTNQRKMLDDVKENFREKGPQILQLLREITPEGQLDGEIPSELRDILDLLAHLGRSLAGATSNYTPPKSCGKYARD